MEPYKLTMHTNLFLLGVHTNLNKRYPSQMHKLSKKTVNILPIISLRKPYNEEKEQDTQVLIEKY